MDQDTNTMIDEFGQPAVPSSDGHDRVGYQDGQQRGRADEVRLTWRHRGPAQDRADGYRRSEVDRCSLRERPSVRHP